MSFIKLNDSIHSKFFTVPEADCESISDTHAEITVDCDTQSWPKEIVLFKDKEEAGKFVREYWDDFINHETPEEVICLLGAETLISWALGREAGPGSTKVSSLKEWLDLHIDVPEEHFEEEYSIEAIGTNLVEILGFKPTIAFSRG